MKRLLPILLLAFASFTSKAGGNPISDSSRSKVVYVCNSKTSVVYHSSDRCRGLNRCTHPIIKLTVADAIKKYGKRACLLCW